MTNSEKETGSADLNWMQITTEIQCGMEPAFEIYYEFVFERVFGVIKSLTRLGDLTCLDILQDTMLRVVRYMKPLPDEAAVTGWTLAVTKSVTYNWLKRQKRTEIAAADWQSDLAASSSLKPEIWDQARLLWIEEQLKELPADLQSMISLRFRTGWNLKQIAAHFGFKTGLVDGRIRRAIAALRQKAEREYDNE